MAPRLHAACFFSFFNVLSHSSRRPSNFNLTRPSLQNICHPELGVWSDQWLVQVDMRLAVSTVCVAICKFARCSCLRFSTCSAAGARWKARIWDPLESVRYGQAKACFCGLSLRPQTDAGYVSGSSIAAAALGLFRKGLPIRFSLFFSCRHHNLGGGC